MRSQSALLELFRVYDNLKEGIRSIFIAYRWFVHVNSPESQLSEKLKKMKRYLVKVKTFDASLYEVLDRYTGKYYDAWVFCVAFRDYPGTLEQLAADIEFTEESIDNLNSVC